MLRLGILADRAPADKYSIALRRCDNIRPAVVCGAAAHALHGAETTEYPIPCCGDADQLFDQFADQIDAIAIHAPLHDRSRFAQQALQLSKSVFVEFPVSLDLEELQQLQDLCQAHSGLLHSFRRSPGGGYRRSLEQARQQQRLGRPGLLRMHDWHCPDDSVESDEIEQAVGIARLADAAAGLMQAVPERVFAVPIGDVENPTGMQVHLSFPTGGMALVDWTRLPAGTHPAYRSYTLVGSDGAAYADDHHNTNLLLGPSWQGLPVSADSDQFGLELTRFAERHQRSPRSACDLSDCRRATRVLLAAIESARTGQCIPIKND